MSAALGDVCPDTCMLDLFYELDSRYMLTSAHLSNLRS